MYRACRIFSTIRNLKFTASWRNLPKRPSFSRLLSGTTRMKAATVAMMARIVAMMPKAPILALRALRLVIGFISTIPFSMCVISISIALPDFDKTTRISYHERESLSTSDQSGQKQDGYPLDKWSQNGYIMYQSSEYLPPWGSNSTSQPAE